MGGAHSPPQAENFGFLAQFSQIFLHSEDISSSVFLKVLVKKVKKYLPLKNPKKGKKEGKKKPGASRRVKKG